MIDVKEKGAYLRRGIIRLNDTEYAFDEAIIICGNLKKERENTYVLTDGVILCRHGKVLYMLGGGKCFSVLFEKDLEIIRQIFRNAWKTKPSQRGFIFRQVTLEV